MILSGNKPNSLRVSSQLCSGIKLWWALTVTVNAYSFAKRIANDFEKSFCGYFG